MRAEGNRGKREKSSGNPIGKGPVSGASGQELRGESHVERCGVHLDSWKTSELCFLGHEDESALALIVALNDEDPSLREHAVDALGEIGVETAIRLLQQALGDQRMMSGKPQQNSWRNFQIRCSNLDARLANRIAAIIA